MGRTIWPAGSDVYHIRQRSQRNAAAEDRLFITGLPPAFSCVFCGTAAEGTRSAFADASTRALFLARLGERGVAADRVELVTWVPAAEHLAFYHRVDIALDPFPYNGTTTTCDALWMGVPVITLRGHRHAGRVGASLLTQIGLTDLIANSIEEYVEIAVALAGNSGRLDDLRRALRPRMAASPMCDEGAFACKMEAAFRSMWQHWCATSPGNE